MFPLGAARAMYQFDARALVPKPDTLVYWRVAKDALPQPPAPRARGAEGAQQGASIKSRMERLASLLFEQNRGEDGEGEGWEEGENETSACVNQRSEAPKGTPIQLPNQQKNSIAHLKTDEPSSFAESFQTTIPISSSSSSSSSSFTFSFNSFDASVDSSSSMYSSSLSSSSSTSALKTWPEIDDMEELPRYPPAYYWQCEARIRQFFAVTCSPCHIDFDFDYTSGIARFFSQKDTQKALLASRSGSIPLKLDILTIAEQDEWWERRRIEIFEARSLEHRKVDLRRQLRKTFSN